MLEPNKDLARIFENAITEATLRNHEYLTLEHFLYGLVMDKKFSALLDEYGADVGELRHDLTTFIDDNLRDIANLADGARPKKTNTIERMLNRAFTQVLFSGRQLIEPVDCLISLFSEKQSHANYFMRKANIEKDTFLEFVTKDTDLVEEKEATKLDAVVRA
jgi:ATP-dependent Clp protease ATP-binding subunit ClpA